MCTLYQMTHASTSILIYMEFECVQNLLYTVGLQVLRYIYMYYTQAQINEDSSCSCLGICSYIKSCLRMFSSPMSPSHLSLRQLHRRKFVGQGMHVRAQHYIMHESSAPLSNRVKMLAERYTCCRHDNCSVVASSTD